MTLNRFTVTFTALIVALFALLAIAATVGSSGAAGATPSRSDGSSAVLPWQHAKAPPVYAKVVYHEHRMCDEIHHKAMKSPAVNP